MSKANRQGPTGRKVLSIAKHPSRVNVSLRATAAATAALLPTKLFVPLLDPGVVERERLLTALNQARRARLLLVSAPAGSGKTTLAAHWVRQLDVPACWVSLDPGDDDPTAFLGYVVEAFQSLGRGTCERTRALVGSGAAPEPRSVAKSLIGELAESGATGVLVLDDYHAITDRAIHEVFTLLIEHSPPSVSFVVVTRSDPPLPLARLRARGHLHEIRESDLRFDEAEVGVLTGRLSRKALRRESVAALAQRTEGWAVGLQLAGLALRQAQDPDAFVAGFTGAHAFVADYLADEVLAGIADEHQRFLVRTASLTRLTGPLCDAVLERTGSQTLLDELHRANLFLVPLDSERRWYRYHHLFADLLRRRGAQGDVIERQALLARAAAWCEQHGAVNDAIDYALQADDVTLAADLVARHGLATLAAGSGVTVLRWIRLLPDTIVRSSPDHCVIAAWALTLMQGYDSIGGVEDVAVERKGGALAPATAHDPIGGYAQQALEVLAAHQRAFPHVDDVEQHARVLLATADAAAGPGAALRALEEARDETPEGNRPLRAVAEIRIGELCSLIGRYEHGLSAQQRAQEIAVLAGSELLRVSAITGRALILLLQGRLRELATTIEAELAGRRTLGESLGMYAGNLYALCAVAHLERHELDAAEQALARAWAAFGASGDEAGAWRSIVRFGRARPRASHLTVQGVLWAFATQIGLLVRRGDLDAAHRHLEEMDAMMPPSVSPTERVVFDVLRVRVWAAADDRARLRRWRQLEPPGSCGMVGWDRALLLARARAALAVGDTVGMRAVLAPLVANVGESECDLTDADALILDGVAAAGAAGGRRVAKDRIAAALALTTPEDRAAPWLNAGSAVVPLLEAAVREGDAPADVLTHASCLLGMLRQAGGSTRKRDPDALSAREVTVLRLLVAGHTNQQIADTLFLAVGSVKKHTHNIFGKLGVANRTQAVQAARERGLL